MENFPSLAHIHIHPTTTNQQLLHIQGPQWSKIPKSRPVKAIKTLQTKHLM
ncbi:hypothetical protein PGT21_037044 [Puccinia graminis f. sp. tritici]|uniref:Uncharacterized protein n=1 Tax=Puccinia graminis f. sp. tritici TaxID=56615 RepID=A0A5B0R3M4_PUCGR|nr:hypothetical protein PGT21_037044 [Puccinia graminis f. sp. tritici]